MRQAAYLPSAFGWLQTLSALQDRPGGTYLAMCVSACVCAFLWRGHVALFLPHLSLIINITCIEHTERRWSRDKVGYGNKDLNFSVGVNIHQLQVFIGLMNDLLLHAQRIGA